MYLLTLLVYFFPVFFKFSLQDKPYNFQPESRHYDVNQGESYVVEYQQIDNQTNITHCYIQSKLINIDYPILPPSNETEDYQILTSDERFHSFNNTGVCGFYYNNIDADSVIEWNVIAFDNFSTQNFSEKISITLYYNLPLYLYQLITFPTGAIINFFDSNKQFEKCTLSFDNSSIEIDQNTIQVYNKSIYGSRLTSIGEGKCGYRITNLSVADTNNLTLYAWDKNDIIYRNTTKMYIIEDEDLKNQTIKVYLGDKTTVKCGKENSYTGQEFCYLYNPKGELVSHDQLCYYEIQMVTIEDIGLWKCLVGDNHLMETLKLYTQLIQISRESVTTFSRNSTYYYTIGCQLVNFTVNSVKYCRFTRPDGKLIKVSKSEASNRYSSISSDLKNGKCSIEILKPLRPEDKGKWKCEAVMGENGITGSFITVDSLTAGYELDQNLKQYIHVGKPFKIDCMVSYSSDYCYIIAPNGTQFLPEYILETLVGSCSFSIAHATPSDNGLWKCSLAQQNGIPDKIITVEVSIIEYNVISKNVEVSEGDTAKLFCNTDGVPTEYCRFVSPTGLSFSLKKEDVDLESNQISYIGRGLDYGDCGLKISKVNSNLEGEWSCHISPGVHKNTKADLSKKIQLKIIPPKSSISVAGSLGLAFGVLTAVVVITAVIFYKYLRPSANIRQNNNANLSQRTSNSSHSGESVVLSLSQTVTYHT